MNHEEMMIEQFNKDLLPSSQVDLTAVIRSDLEDDGIDVNNFSQADLDREILFFRNLEVAGYQVMLRMFKAPSKLSSGLIIRLKNQTDQDFHEYIGLVVKISPIAYTLPRYNGCEPWVKVGDWVVIPRAHANVRYYKGKPIAYIKEDVILGTCKIEDIRHFSEK